MTFEMVPLRHAFEVEGRLPRRPRALHAVSREVTVRVPVLDGGDAPLALAVDRPLSKADQVRYDIWCWVSGRTRVPGVRQAVPLRLANGRLVAPVLGPDMLTPAGPSDLPALFARLPTQPDASFFSTACWPGYPGACRDTPGPGPRVDFLTGRSHPGKQLHLCVDLDRLVDVAGQPHVAADRAFRAAVDGLCIVDGILWQPCGTPVVGVDVAGRGSIVIPGIDATEGFRAGLRPMLALVDFRSGFATRAMSQAEGPGTVVVVDGSPVPWADMAVPNLRLLHGRSTECLAGASFRDVPRAALALVDALDGIPGALAAGTAPEHLQDAVDAAGGALQEQGGGMFETLARDLAGWRSLVRDDRRRRDLDAETMHDAGMDAFSP